MTSDPRTVLRHLHAVCGGLLLLLALPSAAVAATGMQTAKYEMTVSATQSTTWSQDHTYYDGCTDGMHRRVGNGSEQISFKSVRPGPFVALKVDGDVLVNTGAARHAVSGTVTHDHAMSVTQLSGGESGCGDPTASGENHPTLDCGTRSWHGTVLPVVHDAQDFEGDQVTPLSPVLGLGSLEPATELNSFNDLFGYCPGAGGNLAATSNSAFLHKLNFATPAPFTVAGNDSFTKMDPDTGYTATVTISWKASFVPADAARLATRPCVVPKLRKLTLAAARKRLRAANCRLGVVKRQSSRTIAKGRVITTRPVGGKRLPANAKVAVVVSWGARRP